MIYFSSDLHFGHNRDFLYDPRGYNNINDHDEDLIEKWNSIVNYDDEVYLLGDVMLNDNNYGLFCLRRLNGIIHIIRGNHDTDERLNLYNSLYNVDVIGWSTMIKYQGLHFYLSHYPTFTSNFDYEKPLKAKVIGLFGHTHQQAEFFNDNPYMFHVGVDSNNGYPISIDEVIKKVKKKCEEVKK